MRVFGFLLLLLPFALCAQHVDPQFVDGEVFVKRTLQSEANGLDIEAWLPIAAEFGITEMYKPFLGHNADLDRTYRIRFTAENRIDALLEVLDQSQWFEYVEKAPLMRTADEPNDYDRFMQPSLEQVMAPQAWDISTGDSTIVVAVVDNAVWLEHEDLTNRRWINTAEQNGVNGFDDDFNTYNDDIHGYDVADGDNDPSPPEGEAAESGWNHGTHVSGIVSAETNNGLGFASIGRNLRIMAVKATPNSSEDGRTLPNAYDGVSYAMNAGADIINMSWGGGSGIFVTGQAIIEAAAAQGIVLIAAAGNNNSDEPFFPAAYAPVISVAATEETDLKAGYSNYGSTIDLTAPGSRIWSATISATNDYVRSSGTSQAAPLVSGIAGLLLSEEPNLTPNQVRQRLTDFADNIDDINPDFAGQLGAGRVNAFRSLTQEPTAIAPQAQKAFRFYPNPTQGTLHIEHPWTEYTVEVHDLRGALILRQHNASTVEQLAPGSYLVSIRQGEQVVRQVVNSF